MDDGLPMAWERAVIETLTGELENARFMARVAVDFIEKGAFYDDVEGGCEPDTPEWDLWIAKMVYNDARDQNPWVLEDNNG